MAGGLGRWPERLRRDGVPHHGVRRQADSRPARIRDRGHHRRLSGRRQRLSLRHPLHEPPRSRVRAREADRLGGAHRGQRAVLLAPIRGAVRSAAGTSLGRLDRCRVGVAARQPRAPAPEPDHRGAAGRRSGARIRVAAGPGPRCGRGLSRCQLPREGRASGAARSGDRQAHQAPRPQGRGTFLGDLDRARRGVQDAVLRHRQQRSAGPERSRPRDRQGPQAADRRACR